MEAFEPWELRTEGGGAGSALASPVMDAAALDQIPGEGPFSW